MIQVPLFIGIHQKKGAAKKEMVNGWEDYKKSATKKGLKPMKVYISPKAGVGFCLTEAKSGAAVKKGHADAGVQVPSQVFEVEILE